MSYWIEVRCSLQTDSRCYSARQHDTPMMLTYNSSLAAVNLAIIKLSEDAKKLEWRQTTRGLVCPNCHE